MSVAVLHAENFSAFCLGDSSPSRGVRIQGDEKHGRCQAVVLRTRADLSSQFSAGPKLKTLLLRHDWIYDSDYFDKTIEGPAARSAGSIADSILSDLKAASLIDVGCGTGALLEALRQRGCEVFGLEYAEPALRYCRDRGLDVATFDLEQDVFNERRTFDVAVSMEVAEHLPETVADRYVDLLTRLSRVVVLTAAPPGQGGADHINEQPPSYWITKFQQRGFEHVDELSQRWRDRFCSSLAQLVHRAMG